MQSYDDFAGALADYTKEINSTMVTFRYNASKSLMFGAEVSFIKREQFDGTTFDNTRIQGVVKFTF